MADQPVGQIIKNITDDLKVLVRDEGIRAGEEDLRPFASGRRRGDLVGLWYGVSRNEQGGRSSGRGLIDGRGPRHRRRDGRPASAQQRNPWLD